MREASYGPSTRGRGQRGTITKLANGRFKARYREEGRSGNRPSRTFDTQREAADWLAAGLETAARLASGDRSILTLREEAATTCAEGVERYLSTVDCSPETKVRLGHQLAAFTRAFGDRTFQQPPEPYEMEAWRLELKPGWRADVFRETRRMMWTWKRWNWIADNPTDGIVNRRTRPPEVAPMPWETAWALSEEIDAQYAHVPILGCGSGLRPEEWLALEYADVDRREMVIHVRRVLSGFRVVQLGADGAKTWRQRRRVPLREVVLEAIDRQPRPLDPHLPVVPSYRRSQSGFMSLCSFRGRFWTPAFEAAGVGYCKPYAMRHTYATDSIAAKVDLFELSRHMGTSLEQIDRTYGHLASNAEERNRELLNALDAARPRPVSKRWP